MSWKTQFSNWKQRKRTAQLGEQLAASDSVSEELKKELQTENEKSKKYGVWLVDGVRNKRMR